jgi:hypothetical protein
MPINEKQTKTNAPSPNRQNLQYSDSQKTNSPNDKKPSNKKDNQGQNIANAMYKNALASAEEEGISPNFIKNKNSRIKRKSGQHESLPMIPATNSQMKNYPQEGHIASSQVSSSMQQYDTGPNRINLQMVTNKGGGQHP